MYVCVSLNGKLSNSLLRTASEMEVLETYKELSTSTSDCLSAGSRELRRSMGCILDGKVD